MFQTKNVNASIRNEILKQNDNKCKYCENLATKLYASDEKNPRINISELKRSQFICLCNSDASTYLLWAKMSSIGRKESLKVWELTEEGNITEV